jgi:trehalose/maltose hydrolase-like predicted phosphorylase
MGDPHHAGIDWTLIPENWSGRVKVVTATDGRVSNGGVARYRQLEGRHLNPVPPRTFGPEVIALKAETRQSNLYISHAARTRVFAADQCLQVERKLYQVENYIHQVLAFDVQQGTATRVEKMVTFYTSRDPAVSDTLVKAARSAARHTDFAVTFERHAEAWEELWRVCDVQVSGDQRAQLLLRLHIAHVLQVCSRNTADLDARLPARGLDGEAYRGHVSWDEIYAFPFFNVRLPEVTRGLLMYRYRRMGEARAAHEAGFGGAMFPWQSGSEGIEETQLVHLNPVSGLWEPDLSRNQRHVNAAIFYNIWHYFQTTGGQAFLRDYGAEMMLEIAPFWASIAHFNPERERYEIHGVMGPDEFHDKYPDAVRGGLRNNAYTNVMVACPNTAAQRSCGSRRSASGTSRRVPAASRPTAGPPPRGGLRRPITNIRRSSPAEQAADLGAAVVPPGETRDISVGPGAARSVKACVTGPGHHVLNLASSRLSRCAARRRSAMDEHQTGHWMGSSTVAGSRPQHGLAAGAGLGACMP